MDFLLHADEDKIIKLRFYPKHSSLHLFDCGLEKKPSERNFTDVYKIYYSWSILQSTNEYDYDFDEQGKLKISDGICQKIDHWEPFKQVFAMPCDECSALSDIGDLTRYVVKTRENVDHYMSFGQPGSDWNIRYNKGYTYDEYLREWYREEGYNIPDKTGKKEIFGLVTEQEFYEREYGRHPYLEYMVWNYDTGFRFNLDVNKAYEFADYIDQVNQYMLEHGVPI